jgi:hypothetical protein
LYEAPRSRAQDTQIERVVDDTTAPASVSLFAGTTTGRNKDQVARPLRGLDVLRSRRHGAESTIALITALQQARRLQAAAHNASTISAVSTLAAPMQRSAAP